MSIKKKFQDRIKELNPKKRFKALDKFRQIYNSLCRNCQVEMFTLAKRRAGASIPLDKLCVKCKTMAEKKLEEVNELLK